MGIRDSFKRGLGAQPETTRDAVMPHSLVTDLYGQMSLPVISAPMFIVSNPKLVVAQCTSGIVGSFPALNARPQSLLTDWLDEIQAGLASYREANPGAAVAPYAVNQIIHQSNDRLEQDLACLLYTSYLVLCGLHEVDQLWPQTHRKPLSGRWTSVHDTVI